jgi:hypothetical protein
LVKNKAQGRYRSTQSEPQPYTEKSNQHWCRLGESTYWIKTQMIAFPEAVSLIVHKLNYDFRIHVVLHFGDKAWTYSSFHSLISALTGLSITLHCCALYFATL